MKKKLLLLVFFTLNTFALDCKQNNLSKNEMIECKENAKSDGIVVAQIHKKYTLKLKDDDKVDLDDDVIEDICKNSSLSKEHINQKTEKYYLYYCAKGLDYNFSKDNNIKINEFNDYKYDKYQLFRNYTVDINLTNIEKVEEIYFGERKDFNAQTVFSLDAIPFTALEGLIAGTKKGAEAFAKSMTNEGLKHGLTGLGIGLIYGSIKSYTEYVEKKENKEKFINGLNKEYLLVEKITNSNNEQTQKISLIVIQYKNMITKENIKEILKGNI